VENVNNLIRIAGDGTAGYAGYIRALENRRRYFVKQGRCQRIMECGRLDSQTGLVRGRKAAQAGAVW
jgi:hypothetical protein